ncbi:MAG TPA: alcohol dehydrogenase catalytic domain-containing protein, partial [Candidatus Binatia bacterium]
MKAVRIHARGGIDVLRHEECEEPQLEGPTDVRVKLLAAAVNRIDLELRAGSKSSLVFPHILGCDGAGLIDALAPEVTHLKLGDEVCIYPFLD